MTFGSGKKVSTSVKFKIVVLQLLYAIFVTVAYDRSSFKTRSDIAKTVSDLVLDLEDEDGN